MVVDYIEPNISNNSLTHLPPCPPPPFFSNFADFDDCYSLAYYVDIARKNLTIPPIARLRLATSALNLLTDSI